MKTLLTICAIIGLLCDSAQAGPIERHAKRAITLQAKADRLAVRAGSHRATAASYSTRVYVSLPAAAVIEYPETYYVVP